MWVQHVCSITTRSPRHSVRSSLHDARMAALQADQERANMLSLAAAQRAESPAGPSSLGEEALLPPAGSLFPAHHACC